MKPLTLELVYHFNQNTVPNAFVATACVIAASSRRCCLTQAAAHCAFLRHSAVGPAVG